MEKKVEHVGWTLKGRCREVAVSVDEDLVSAIIYGETISGGKCGRETKNNQSNQV